MVSLNRGSACHSRTSFQNIVLEYRFIKTQLLVILNFDRISETWEYDFNFELFKGH